MAKGYWVVTYQKIHKPEQLVEYSKLAGPAIRDGGGKMLVRGVPVFVHGAGLNERTVVSEFASVDEALATFRSDAYQEALRVLGDAVERDFRVIEGTD